MLTKSFKRLEILHLLGAQAMHPPTATVVDGRKTTCKQTEIPSCIRMMGLIMSQKHLLGPG